MIFVACCEKFVIVWHVEMLNFLVFCMLQDSLDGKPEVLLDPNEFSEDGTVALSSLAVSEDAKYLAYGVSSSGSDWVNIRVLRVEDKMIEADTLSWVNPYAYYITLLYWTSSPSEHFAVYD